MKNSSSLFSSLRRTRHMILLLLWLALTGTVSSMLAIPVAAQDAPLARITLPVRGQTLQGSITIQGSATSPLFARYEIAYALEPDLANWTVINGTLQPVQNGSLAVWNTRPVPDGKYALRLQVFNNDGTLTETMVRDLEIANASATDALEPSEDTLNSTTTTTDTLGGTVGVDADGDTDASFDLASIPSAFVKGARYSLYAFAALGAYLLLKKLVGLLLRRANKRPIDYGQ